MIIPAPAILPDPETLPPPTPPVWPSQSGGFFKTLSSTAADIVRVVFQVVFEQEGRRFPEAM